MPSTYRTTTIRMAATVIVALLLAACTRESNPVTHIDNTLHYGGWRQIPAREVAHAETVTMNHRVGFELGSSAISPAEQDRISEFVQQLASGRTNDIALVAPNLIADQSLGAARLRAVTAELASHGLKSRLAPAGRSRMVNNENQVAVVVSFTMVMIPDCPTKQPRLHKRPDLNLGCSTERNLAAMVADPADLERGRSLGAADAGVIGAAIDRYRKDKVKKLIKESTE